MTIENEFILVVSCPDQPGIVHAVSGFLLQHRLNIVDSQQFGDPTSKRFFMRVHFEQTVTRLTNTDIPSDLASSLTNGSADTSGQGLVSLVSVASLKAEFESVAAPLAMDYEFTSAAAKPRVLILVSKIGHCLNDLLFRQSIGQLNITVPLIVSNHNDFQSLAQSYNIPFIHLPTNGTPESKQTQEARILELIDEHVIDLVVLARYMQILSPSLCEKMSGKIINIHHSFLPSFKGAKPYHQAYDRGVKIIGATAHFVTSDLDEGPIIEQNVVRVNHVLSPKELTAQGSDVERNVLATAVKWVSEKRVLLNGQKTVVFNS
ncbi:hypothetical protein HK100_001606 [Physocladia obscura]|uniref:ACT domain-containing protein n=1 Tax=Physocladia obscura TaxID=109957 RepID=A0AAD5SWX7_9FUNG|nr:hypothetical protein HK100_001606 [Physocladia obscura]